MKVLKNVPEGIGEGEGGGSLPKLYEIFEEIDNELDSLKKEVAKKADS